MGRWRRFSYSISIAVLLTALAHLFYPGIGELLAGPGLTFEGWVNILILMMSKEQYPFQFYNWMGFSILFNTISVYLVMSLYSIISKASAKAAIK
jgi:hypothetical protein